LYREREGLSGMQFSELNQFIIVMKLVKNFSIFVHNIHNQPLVKIPVSFLIEDLNGQLSQRGKLKSSKDGSVYFGNIVLRKTDHSIHLLIKHIDVVTTKKIKLSELDLDDESGTLFLTIKPSNLTTLWDTVLREWYTNEYYF
jgi:hypothetical protein